MKKLLTIVLVLAMLLSVTSCAQKVETEEVAPAEETEAAAPVAEISFPEDTITIICPYGAGGGTDALSRKIAELASAELGVDVIVVNKTGGAGAVGMGEGAFAKADGYTVTLATIEAVLLPLAGLAPFQPSDFRTLVRVNFDPASIVVRAGEYDSFEAFIEYAKANPGELNVMTSSFPTNYWLTTTLVEEKAGVSFNKVTAQAGAADQIQNILGGHVDAITVSPAEAAQMVNDGQLEILAVAGEQRDPNFPDVPLMSELGYDIQMGPWRGLLLPKDVPDDVFAVLDAAFTKVVHSDELKSFMSEAGFGYAYMPAVEFQEYMDKQTAEFTPIIEKYK